VGTISGIYILSVKGKFISRIDSEHYLQGMNVWNVREYDVNKLICTSWKDSNCFLVDRNQSDVKRVSIHDPDYMNMHATDLAPLPSYDPIQCPFFVKRGQNSLSLVDVKHQQQYLLYSDANSRWGYSKLSIVDRLNGRFDLVFVTNDGPNASVIKRYCFPAIFEEGLRKVVNLKPKPEETLLSRIIKSFKK
jgi:hypothetical protein